VVQGFGNVGSVSAAALAKQGVRIVGISDHSVALHDPKGFDLEAVFRHLRQVGVLKGFAQQAEVDPKALLVSECDVLVPAAVERVIDRSDAGALKCRIIAEGANGPTTPDADATIEARGDIFVKRRRRDRQLFRVGAGSPEIVLERTGRHEEALRDIGPQFRASHAASRANGHIEQKRGALHRSPTGARCHGNEGIVSLRRPALRTALAADCADGRRITGRLCGLNDRKNCKAATERA